MNRSILDNVELNAADRCSVNYAKARCALDQLIKEETDHIQKVQKGNNAMAKRLAKELHCFVIDSKVAVIRHLKGKVEPKGNGRIVKFFDGSEAKY